MLLEKKYWGTGVILSPRDKWQFGFFNGLPKIRSEIVWSACFYHEAESLDTVQIT